MSLFADMMRDAGTPLLLEASGQEVTLITAQGVTIPAVTALVSSEQQKLDYGPRGRMIVRLRSFTLHSDPASEYGGIRNVAIGGSAVYTDHLGNRWSYSIVEVQSASDGAVTLVGHRTSASAVTREGALGRN